MTSHRTEPAGLDRRTFLQAAGVVGASSIVGLPSLATTPESKVKRLYASFSDDQKKTVCFPWDHVSRGRLLRTRVTPNWRITKPSIDGGFYTEAQQRLIREVFEGIISPAWLERVDRQLEEDTGGFGHEQSIAIFGRPDQGKFEFVLTGRHTTLRCDGNSTDHVAFGGPIFYGHAAGGDREGPRHPGNSYWEQAVVANKVYTMLDGKQREQALIARAPRESAVQFRGDPAKIPGIRIADLSKDQKEHARKVLRKLVEPFRKSDRDEVVQCLKKQGGLDRCRLAFFASGDIGDDEVWDNWRLEGPSFVWHFRGSPHVHVWVNVADDSSVKINRRR